MLIAVLGWLSTGSYGYRHAKADALFPFIVVRNQEVLTPLVLNHERIHHRQQLETLYIGLSLRTLAERVYATSIPGLTQQERYFYLASEQEVHLYQANPDYLETRRLFSLFRHVFYKQRFEYITGQEPAVRIVD